VLFATSELPLNLSDGPWLFKNVFFLRGGWRHGSKYVAGYAQIYIINPDRNIIEFNCETMDWGDPIFRIVRKANLASVCFRLP
jgi:hypothetical protein